MTANSEFLSIRNVSMHFGGLQALADVSFDVAEGSVVGLIGPNGSGKSTLLQIVSGILEPTRGRVVSGSARRDVAEGGVETPSV